MAASISPVVAILLSIVLLLSCSMLFLLSCLTPICTANCYRFIPLYTATVNARVNAGLKMENIG